MIPLTKSSGLPYGSLSLHLEGSYRESIQVICRLVVSSPLGRKVELKWKLTGSHLERGPGVNAAKVKPLWERGRSWPSQDSQC